MLISGWVNRPAMNEGANMQVRSTIIRVLKFSNGARLVAIFSALALLQLVPATRADAQICGSGGCSNATDPGPRGAPAGGRRAFLRLKFFPPGGGAPPR